MDHTAGPHTLTSQALKGGDEVSAQEAGAGGHLAGELAPALLCRRVAVHGDQLALRAEPLGDQAGVTAAAESAVDEGLHRAGIEEIDELLSENGFVVLGHI